MTAVALPAFAPAPSLPRLVAIELRKTVDTRAGFWLLASSALLVLAVAVAQPRRSATRGTRCSASSSSGRSGPAAS